MTSLPHLHSEGAASGCRLRLLLRWVKSSSGESAAGTNFFPGVIYSVYRVASLSIYSTTCESIFKHVRQHAHARYDHSKYIIICYCYYWGENYSLSLHLRTNPMWIFRGICQDLMTVGGSNKILKPHSFSVPVRKYTCSSTQTYPRGWCWGNLSGRQQACRWQSWATPSTRLLLGTTPHSNLMNLHFMTEVIRMKHFKITKR